MLYQMQRFSPYVKGLIIANVAIFVVQLIPAWHIGRIVTSICANVPLDAFARLQIWRFATYMFLHDTNAIFHILFNMLALWWFGAELEDIWGGKKFLLFYFICGIGAGLFSVFYLFFNPYVMVVGASGAVLGVLTAYAHYYPDRSVLLFFVLPIKIKTLVIGYAVVSALFTFMGGGNISHITHLGGILVAWFYLVWLPKIQFGVERRIYNLKKNRRR